MTKYRFEALDVFRGLFSSMVVFYHMSNFSATPLLNNNLVYNSDLFVDFFFVLSGFVICYTYQQLHKLGDVALFLKKRFLRLYPLHLLMLLVFVAIEVPKYFLAGHVKINNVVDNSPTTFVTSLLLLNAVKLPGVKDVGWNIPSWSISAEIISYVCFVLVLMCIAKLKLAAIKNLVYLGTVLLAFTGIYLFTGSLQLNHSFDYGFLRGIAGFFTGVLCFNAFIACQARLGNTKKIFFDLAECASLAALLYFVCNGDVFKNIGFVYELLFFASIFIFAFQKGFVSLLLNKPGILKKMGRYSYSIYMVHTLFISLFNVVFIRLLKLPPSAYGYLFIINYYVIFKVSEWTYHHVEMRFAYKAPKLLAKN